MFIYEIMFLHGTTDKRNVEDQAKSFCFRQPLCLSTLVMFPRHACDVLSPGYHVFIFRSILKVTSRIPLPSSILIPPIP